MIREFKKRQTSVDLYELKGHLEGHIFSYGRIGGGKSVSTLSIIQGFHDNYGYKIFDLFGGERHEGLFWTLPSQDTNYWIKLGSIGKFDEEGPKQYKVNLLYPYFESKLPKKLPKKNPYVTSKIFTIPMTSLIAEDVSMVIGSTSETSKYELNELLYNINKKTNSGNVVDLIESKKMKMLKTTLFYKNFLLPLIRNKFLMDNYCDNNLDLISEMKDRETISVLCLDYVPEQFHIFILNYILRNVMDLIDLNKIPKKNIGFIREAATFFRATDDSVLDDRFKMFRTIMAHYIRMGRRGFHQVLDCIEENTKIKTLDGLKTLKELPEEFKVNSYNFKKKCFEKDIAKKIYSGKRECYKIKFENGEEVIVTGKHRFFDKNNKEIRVEDMKIGDEVLFTK